MIILITIFNKINRIKLLNPLFNVNISSLYETNRRTITISFYSLRFARTLNGHNSVSFYLIFKIQNSTDPCVYEVLEYVKCMCLAFIRGNHTCLNDDVQKVKIMHCPPSNEYNSSNSFGIFQQL